MARLLGLSPELRRQRLWAVLSVLLLAVSLWLFLRDNSGLGDSWFSWLGFFGEHDKLSHALVFFAYGAWFASLTAPARWPRVALLLILWAVLIEVLQGVVPTGRSAEALDVVADAAGLGLGFLAAHGACRQWLQRVDRWVADGA